MRRQTCQNISTASFTALKYTFARKWSAMSCDRLRAVQYMCSGGCVFLVLTTTLWLTSCSICCTSIKQTDHINCIDFSGNMTAIEHTPHLISFGAHQQPDTRMHVHPSCWLFWSALCFLEGVWVTLPSTVCMYCMCVSVSVSTFVFLCPFPSTFICPPEGRGLTTGWGSMNCCVVLSQRRILFRSPPGG